VVGAALPVIVGTILEGWPGSLRIAAMGIGIAGIWLVSRAAGAGGGPAAGGLLLAVLAGVAFGGFFVLIAQVERGLLFSPLVIAKCAALAAALLLLRRERLAFPDARANPVAVLAGLLDAGGNVLYLLARQFTRLDVAAVLASMYPAATVILARAVLREEIAPRQWLGVFFCLAAVALIAV
jgi:drug/metabolite transporter (DMT)-like permease